MFKIFLFLTFVALLHAKQLHNAAVTAADDDDNAAAQKLAKFVDILESSSELKKDGSYAFSYRGEDGTSRAEQAHVANAGSKKEHLEVTGSYSFIDSNGEEVVVNYHAGQNGFVPVGSNIPVEISRAAQNAADLPRAAEEEDEEEHEEEEEQ